MLRNYKGTIRMSPFGLSGDQFFESAPIIGRSIAEKAKEFACATNYTETDGWEISSSCEPHWRINIDEKQGNLGLTFDIYTEQSYEEFVQNMAKAFWHRFNCICDYDLAIRFQEIVDRSVDFNFAQQKDIFKVW